MTHGRISIRSCAAACVCTLGCSVSYASAAGGGGLYFGDLGQALASVIAFVILLLILKKFAWKPVLEQLDKREKDIQSRLKDAHDKEEKASELEEDYRHRMQAVNAEAEQIRNEIRRQAEEQKQQIIAATQAQAHQMIQRAGADIETAKAEAVHQLQSQTARLVAEIAQHVLGRNLSSDEHARLIEEASDYIADKVGDDR
ncbi:MAG TPA: F0F1 ATP synthase subunit B [Phycisphaerae bacterium]|mgnify:CR=1 FL=1|nr:F0F1 ATP synthase subunit B [Phycisphaerae bacterium]HPS52612.1 F0F1 ATP synthase subunit B [Phycisphaerae bacterium]